MVISTVCSVTGEPDAVVKNVLATSLQTLSLKILHTASWHAPPPPQIRSNTDSKALQLWQHFKLSCLPWLCLMLTSHVKKKKKKIAGITRGKYAGDAWRLGMENDKTGCPSSFTLSTGLSQFYSQREAFSSPSFEQIQSAVHRIEM